jgi:type IV pilus assembly protein PilC
MTTYIYKVRDKSGKVLRGQMEAADAKNLRNKLDAKEYFIIDFSEKKSKKRMLVEDILPAGQDITYDHLAVFSWQLYTMLDAGLTLINGLKIIMGQMKHPHFKAVISDVTRRVEEGTSFSESLKEHPQVFSQFFVQMVNAGEVGGVLDEMLKRVAQYYESQAQMRAKIKAALVYPVVLLVMSIGVIVFLITYVLPQFMFIFEEIGTDIPWPTQFLLKVNQALKDYWILFVGAIGGFFVLVKMYTLTERGRFEYDWFVLKAPIIGDLNTKSAAARLTQTLSILVGGGIPILTALDVATEVFENKVIQKTLKAVSVSVGEGKPIAQPLERSKLFPELVVNMIRVGEETGSLSAMLDKIAEFYKREVSNAIEIFTRLLEPILMILMAGIIGFIAVSIFLPLMNMMRSFKG